MIRRPAPEPWSSADLALPEIEQSLQDTFTERLRQFMLLVDEPASVDLSGVHFHDPLPQRRRLWSMFPNVLDDRKAEQVWGCFIRGNHQIKAVVLELDVAQHVG